ncbi:MAG: hypothetical protein NUV51_08345 [Sulfuricaulis sp.]|nr:hypothetical protein [Sulfuricaulis sp.]
MTAKTTKRRNEMPAQHDLYKTGDDDAPLQIKDRNGDVVLGLCRRCGRGEIELDQPCGKQADAQRYHHLLDE